MKFQIYCNNLVLLKVNKTALYFAIDEGNIEIIKLLLSMKNIDVNIETISKMFYVFILFRMRYFNHILIKN